MSSHRLRNVLIVLGIVIVGVWLLQFLWGLISQFGAVVVTLLLAWIINLGALGPVRLLHRLKIPRWIGATLVYLMFAALVGVAGFFVLPPLFAQIGAAAGQLTETAREVPDQLLNLREQLVRLGVPADFVDELITGFTEQMVRLGQDVATNIVNATGTVLGGLGLAFLTLIISFYILLGWDANMRRIRQLLPRAWEARFQRGVRIAERTFGGWLTGQLIASTIWGAALVLIYFVADLPYGLLVAVATGLLMFIPFVGMVAGIALPIIMALTVRIDLAIWVGITVSVISLVIENAIKPRVVGTAIGVNPLVVIVSVIVGGVAAGFWGILFGIPIGALLWAFVRWAVLEILRAQQQREGRLGLDISPEVGEVASTSVGPASPPPDADEEAGAEVPGERAR